MAWVPCAALLFFAACGARTELGGHVYDSGVALDASTERNCGFDCTIGHQCCVGGCNGPPAKMLNDCCECLPGEANSEFCGHKDQCGQ